MRASALRSALLPAVLALLVAAALPVTAQDDPTRADDTYNIKVKVRYKTPDGRKPLAGAPVYLVYPDGTEAIRCTNAKGVAKFRDVPTGDEYMLYTGPAFGKPKKKCTNWKFRNPDTNKKMYTVAWAEGKNTNGIRPTDTFSLPMANSDGKQGDYEWLMFSFKAKTPAKQWILCHGLEATYTGTNGADFFNGTPAFDDIISGRGGDDILGGQCGDDIICGGPGDDHLFGDEHNDFLFGGAGNDVLDGGPGRDYLSGDIGDDTCTNGSIVLSC